MFLLCSLVTARRSPLTPTHSVKHNKSTSVTFLVWAPTCWICLLTNFFNPRKTAGILNTTSIHKVMICYIYTTTATLHH